MGYPYVSIKSISIWFMKKNIDITAYILAQSSSISLLKKYKKTESRHKTIRDKFY